MALWNIGVSKTWEFFTVWIDENNVECVEIWCNNATADGLSLWLSFTALTETLRTFFQEETNTVVLKNTLHHWETLTVVTTSDFECATSKSWINESTINFLSDTQVMYSLTFTEIVNSVAF